MQLYYFETPNPRKACAVARYLELPVDFQRIDLSRGEHKTPAYLAINPNGKVPALVDGDVRLWESHAIMIYLAQKAGSELWPSDEAARIEVVKWLLWDANHFTRHAQRFLWENYVKPKFGLGATNAAEVADAAGFFRQFARVLDDHLRGRSHIVGDGLTVADFGLAGFLPMAAEAQLPLDEFTEIVRWHDSLMRIPAWRDPWPAVRKVA